MPAPTLAPRLVVPDSRFRSPTAVDAKSDFRDENIYSSIVLQGTGAGQQKLFTVPQGQTIPALGGTATASANAWQKTYTETTTNLTKAGELGSGIGDAAVRAIGITFEQAGYSVTAGVPNAYGMTNQEASDVTSKCFFQLRIANKPQIIGPVFAFPAAGGVAGAISTTGNNTTVSIQNNGIPGNLRRLKIPIPVARNDTLEGVFGVGGSATLLANTLSGADKQPSLAWVTLYANVAGDVR